MHISNLPGFGPEPRKPDLVARIGLIGLSGTFSALLFIMAMMAFPSKG